MEQKTEQTGRYSIDNILLLESSFKRKVHIDFNRNDIKSSINISREASNSEHQKGNKIVVTVTLTIESVQESETIISITTQMVGIFTKHGNPQLDEDIFKKLNGPAIIYPFIREHVSTVCLKAGLGNTFLLPPVNFVEMNQSSQDEE